MQNAISYAEGDFYTKCDFDTHECDCDTHDYDLCRHACGHIMRVILAPCVVSLALCVWFWHITCALNTNACDFDTLRVKLLYYNTYINLSCRHMPDAITRLRVESTHCRHCNRTILRVDSTRKFKIYILI
jgi:hypothetical protein